MELIEVESGSSMRAALLSFPMPRFAPAAPNSALELTRGPFVGRVEPTAWRHAGCFSLPPAAPSGAAAVVPREVGTWCPRAAQRGRSADGDSTTKIAHS